MNSDITVVCAKKYTYFDEQIGRIYLLINYFTIEGCDFIKSLHNY